ncbi:DUF805 domain-containing protein [Saccharibacter floricola]|uniref:SHOCT domain-containing protein n=1 Tax=Saccharibacter floricola DSM 15669 TaxID=1123227 RepID=A0ABQ0NXH0_9PROT|nr:DUF805 domain-containing protein [Saccharibacter floricola]GBQ05506.1 hypothetical protein AA15669_0493 [Saccharibacter floricola DSM 15669]
METSNPFYCFVLALRHYAHFKGRTRRREFWYFNLCYYLISFSLTGASFIVHESKNILLIDAVQIVSVIYHLAMIIPNLSVNARRLHDSNHSGWWMLLPVVNLVFYCLDSDPQTNRFGPNPKAGEGPQWGDGCAQFNNSFSSDNLEKIEKLGKLRNQGILTEEEFQKKKKELL